MIKGISLSTNELNIENLTAFGQEVGGSGIFFETNIYYNELTQEQKDIYDAAINIANSNFYTDIINTEAEILINRVTSTPLIEGLDLIDFLTLSESDKDKFRAFLALLITLKS